MGLYAVWSERLVVFAYDLFQAFTVDDINNNAPFDAQIYEASNKEEAIGKYKQEN